MNIVIIGNGVAGIEAALAIREARPEWSITIISEESDHFFSRTALMWVFTGQLSHRCIEPFERDLYTRENFQRVRARAVGVDLAAQTVLISGGDPIAYDKLVVACGSRARPGPWEGSTLPGVGSFVTLSDLSWLQEEVLGPDQVKEPVRPGEHHSSSSDASPYWPRAVAASLRGKLASAPIVIGGGLIGIEAVEVLVERGLKPKFLIREEWFWPMALDKAESKWIAARMASHGVEVLLEHNVESLKPDASGGLGSVVTDQGTFDTDLAVIAIGVIPNTEWLEESGLELSRGAILVDKRLRTSDPNVFSAGDCAAVPWFDGKHRPEALWYSARDQGRALAETVLRGEDGAGGYERGLFYNSAKLMDIEYTTCGMVHMNIEGEQNWRFEETGSVRSSTRITLADGKVIGFNLLGRRWDHEVLLSWIEAGKDLKFVLAHLNTAGFDTEFTPPLVLPANAENHPLEGPAPSGIPSPIPYPF